MKKDISKILLHLTVFVLLSGLIINYFAEGFGVFLVIFFGRFISPLIIVVLLVEKLFFRTENNNRFFYLSMILNLALALGVLYALYHAFDNFNLML